jgi:putative endonuclease
MTNQHNRVLYTGVTSDLKRRVYEHKEKLIDGFTKKYNITKLVYCEIFENVYDAIEREKQIKAGSRQKKLIYLMILTNNGKICMMSCKKVIRGFALLF